MTSPARIWPAVFRLAALGLAGLVVWPAFGQENANANQPLQGIHPSTPTATTASGLGEGPIASGDIVEVQIYDAPDMSLRTQVSPTGDIALPVLGVYHIAGTTAADAGLQLARAYSSKGLLRDPRVLVSVQQLSAGITVLGEVTAPGTYPLTGRRRLIDVLASAGGVTPRAGHIIEIHRADNPAGTEGVVWDPTLHDRSALEVSLKAGDSVLVSRCGVVYVNGNVARPGAFPVCDSSKMTISRAIALAEGLKPSTSLNRTLLIRTANGAHTVEQLRLDDILHGRAPDQPLQEEDVLYVQPSAIKAGIKRATELGLAFATTSAVYFH